MPTVAIEGQFRFVVNTRESAFDLLTSMFGPATKTCAG